MENSLLYNLTFWSAFAGWMLAQLFKFVRKLLKTHTFDLSCFVSTGGMPSAHTSMVCALMTSVGMLEGFASPVFALAIAFAGIVMFDAQGVRHAAGLQARLLNQIISELFREHHLSQKKLVELLGHTRLEVFFGMLLGIGCALLIHHLWG